MLPHEFDKKEEDPLADAGIAVEVLHRQTETGVEWPQGIDGCPPDPSQQSGVGPNDDKEGL